MPLRRRSLAACQIVLYGVGLGCEFPLRRQCQIMAGHFNGFVRLNDFIRIARIAALPACKAPRALQLKFAAQHHFAASRGQCAGDRHIGILIMAAAVRYFARFCRYPAGRVVTARIAQLILAVRYPRPVSHQHIISIHIRNRAGQIAADRGILIRPSVERPVSRHAAYRIFN